VYVTHDGGLQWRQVEAVGHSAVGSLSVAGGRVWAPAGQFGSQQAPVVLSGPDAGSTLTPVPSEQRGDGVIMAGGQPPPMSMSSPTPCRARPQTTAGGAGTTWPKLVRRP
jgi:hypothetical protein